MCLILFAYQVHPEYKLVMAANRDEFYERPTARANWWSENPDLLAGKDLQAGGTWLGMNKSGRFAALTNYREPGKVIPDAPSRGALATDFLTQEEAPAAYFDALYAQGHAYNGFNLLAGNADQLWHYSNRAGRPALLMPGIYGLSNHLLNTPWPKIRRGRDQLTQVLKSAFSAEDLFGLLRDKQVAPVQQLPDTGLSLEWEETLSAMFIESPTYGTRVSSVLMIDHQNQVFFEERAYMPEGAPAVFQFPAHATSPPTFSP